MNFNLNRNLVFKGITKGIARILKLFGFYTANAFIKTTDVHKISKSENAKSFGSVLDSGMNGPSVEWLHDCAQPFFLSVSVLSSLGYNGVPSGAVECSQHLDKHPKLGTALLCCEHSCVVP